MTKITEKATEKKVNIFIAKRALIDVLERLMNVLDEIKNDNLREYKVIGKKDEQDTHWRTGELLWEDEEKTIPKMKDIYGYVDIPEDELSEEAIAKIKAVDMARATLETLL